MRFRCWIWNVMGFQKGRSLDRPVITGDVLGQNGAKRLFDAPRQDGDMARPRCAGLIARVGSIKGQNGHHPASLRVVCRPAGKQARKGKGRAWTPAWLRHRLGAWGHVLVDGMTADVMTEDVQPASQIASCDAGSRCWRVSLQRDPTRYR